MCHVLVIEDEWSIAEMICELLSDIGATSFDVAMSESEAIDLAALRQPQVITADVRLAEGTGPSAVETIHDRHGYIPTIFITALPEECEPCDHAVAVLPKPFAVPALFEAFASAWTAP